jgi:hypothetical protein
VVRAFQQVQQHLLFFVAVGHDELAAVLVVDAVFLAVGIQGAVAGHAEARLEAARRVIQARVDHAAVARRGDGARVRLGLEQQHLASDQRQRARDREAHDTRTDDDAFDPIGHILNLSCKQKFSAASSPSFRSPSPCWVARRLRTTPIRRSRTRPWSARPCTP